MLRVPHPVNNSYCQDAVVHGLVDNDISALYEDTCGAAQLWPGDSHIGMITGEFQLIEDAP